MERLGCLLQMKSLEEVGYCDIVKTTPNGERVYRWWKESLQKISAINMRSIVESSATKKEDMLMMFIHAVDDKTVSTSSSSLSTEIASMPCTFNMNYQLRRQDHLLCAYGKIIMMIMISVRYQYQTSPCSPIHMIELPLEREKDVSKCSCQQEDILSSGFDSGIWYLSTT